MKAKFILIGLIISLLGYSQSRTFPEFPENSSPSYGDIVIIWDTSAAKNYKTQIQDLILIGSVGAVHLDDDVDGDGLGQHGNGALKVLVDGTTITITNDTLSANAGNLSGQGTYNLSNIAESDTLQIVIDDTYASFYHKGGDQIQFYEQGTLALLLSDLFQVMYYNGGIKFWTTSQGVRVDDTLFLAGSNVYIGTDGTTMSFTDVETGNTYSLLDLTSSGSVDLSGEESYGILFNESGVIETESDFEFYPSTHQLLNCNGGTLGGSYSIILGGQTNTTDDSYCCVTNGVNVSLTGTHSRGQGNSVSGTDYYQDLFGNNITATGRYNKAHGIGLLAHDYGEVALCHYNTQAGGNQTSIAAGNRIFVIGNGTGTGARSNALEVYANGRVYAPDSLESSLIKATSDFKIRDTTLLIWLNEHKPDKLHVNISKDGNITSFNTLVTLTAYVNETGVTYNWDGGAGSNKTLITPTAGNHNVVVSKSGYINDTAEIYIVDQTDFHENYNIELPPYSATDTVLSKNYHPGLSSVDTSAAMTATELLVATGSTTAASEDSATWNNGGLNITGDIDISDTLTIATVDINGGNTNPTGTTRLNIEGTIVPYNIWAYAPNTILGNGVIQGTYSGATTTYSGVRGVASGGGIGVLAETQTFIGGTPLKVKSAILGDSKHSVFMNGSDTLAVLDSVSLRIKNIFSVQDSLIVYPDSSTFTGYHVADSFVMTNRTVVSDFVFEDGYNYGTFWEDLQYAMQNKTLPSLKDHSRSIGTRQENTIEALERLYLQIADELIIRDNEIIRLERKIDAIQLVKSDKLTLLAFIFIGLLFIYCIILTLKMRKTLKVK